MATLPPLLDGLLFRYRSFNKDLPQQEQQILSESRLWFAGPRTYNDPFEARPSATWSRDGRVSNRDATRMVKRQMPGATRAEQQPYIERIFQQARDPAMREHLKREIERGVLDILDQTSLCSLSRRCDSLPMWGLYASSHSGYCLGFNKDLVWGPIPVAGNALPLVPWQVDYTDDYPFVDYDLPRDDQDATWEAVRRSLLTKSSDWAFEEEERLIRPEVPAGLQEFKANDLRALILGARIESAAEETLLRLAEARPGSLAVFRARPAVGRFELEFDQVR